MGERWRVQGIERERERESLREERERESIGIELKYWVEEECKLRPGNVLIV